MTKSIKSFSGEYRFLSNFYPTEIESAHIIFPTTEHAYQASKMLMGIDRMAIAQLSTPGKAKRMGKQLKMRPDWEDAKLDLMKDILIVKFTIPELRSKLLSTGDAHLEEGNTWGDQFWGTVDGVGENHLGKILMEIRDEIRSKE